MKSIKVYLTQPVIFVLTKQISLMNSQIEKIISITGMIILKIMMSNMVKRGVKWDCVQG